MSAAKVATIAAEYELSEDVVRKAINTGHLPAYRVGRGIRIHREDAAEWFRSLTRVGSEQDREARA